MPRRVRLRRWLLRGTGLLVVSSALSGCFASPPQIIEIDPNRGSTSVVADQPITVVFDRTIDHSSVAARFSVTPGLPGCDLQAAFAAQPTACAITWLTDRSGFELLHPAALFAPATVYTFRIAAGVRAQDGTVNQLDHAWQLTTQQPATVVGTTPSASATGVPIDSTFGIEFDRPMSPVYTAAAISVSPPIVAARVLRNRIDLNRFVVVPGQLLKPNTRYTITVAESARDAHGQRLDEAHSFTVTTGGLSPGRHVTGTVTNGADGATSVVITTSVAPSPGEPAAVATVVSDPGGGPTLSAPALGPGGSRLAVEETGPAGERLRVIDVASSREISDIPGARLAAWSGAGDLAYARSNALDVVRPSGSTLTIQLAEPQISAPVWSANATLVAVTTGGPDATPTVTIVAPATATRFAIPGLPSDAAITDPHFAPDSSEIAVRVDSAQNPAVDGTWVAPLTSGNAAQLIDPIGTPIGFADATTIIAAERSPSGDQLVRLPLGGSAIPLQGGPPSSALGSAVLSNDGRQIAWAAPSGTSDGAIWVANGDGSRAEPLSDFDAATTVADVGFSP